MNAYFNHSDIQKKTLEDRFTSIICSIISFFTNKTLVNFIKLAVISVGLFFFFATIGKIDNGSMGVFAGIMVCATISLLEIIVIGSFTDQKK